MMISFLKKVVLLVLICVLAGCKLWVIVVEGGEVHSPASGPWIGSGICRINTTYPTYPPTGIVCIHEVFDTSYSETFTAVADRGWYFVKWNSGDGFLCPDSTRPTCTVSNIGLAGNADMESLVASDVTFYIMPIFALTEPEPIPETDTVTVRGKTWAQPDLFIDVPLSKEIEAACPGGVCEGRLRHYDMTGWTWASVKDLNALFNHYIGNEAMGPGPSTYSMLEGLPWTDAFFSDGWRKMRWGAIEDTIYGMLLDGGAGMQQHGYFDQPYASTIDGLVPNHGGWFYRLHYENLP